MVDNQRQGPRRAHEQTTPPPQQPQQQQPDSEDKTRHQLVHTVTAIATDLQHEDADTADLLLRLRTSTQHSFDVEARRMAAVGYPCRASHCRTHDQLADQIAAAANALNALNTQPAGDAAGGVRNRADAVESVRRIAASVRRHATHEDFAVAAFLRPRDADEGRAPETTQGPTPEALLVGTDDDNASFADALGDQELALHQAADAAEATALVTTHKLDAAFLTLGSPTIDAFELLRALRTSRSNNRIPVIAIASVGPDAEALAAKAALGGFTGTLGKPVQASHLRQLLTSLHWRIANERRHYQRAPTELTVLCAHGGQQQIGHSENLSACGMLLRLEKPPPVGATVTLTFAPGDITRFVSVTAEVVRASQDGLVAVAFGDIRTHEREQLCAYVADLLTP